MREPVHAPRDENDRHADLESIGREADARGGRRRKIETEHREVDRRPGALYQPKWLGGGLSAPSHRQWSNRALREFVKVLEERSARRLRRVMCEENRAVLHDDGRLAHARMESRRDLHLALGTIARRFHSASPRDVATGLMHGESCEK